MTELKTLKPDDRFILNDGEFVVVGPDRYYEDTVWVRRWNTQALSRLYVNTLVRKVVTS